MNAANRWKPNLRAVIACFVSIFAIVCGIAVVRHDRHREWTTEVPPAGGWYEPGIVFDGAQLTRMAIISNNVSSVGIASYGCFRAFATDPAPPGCEPVSWSWLCGFPIDALDPDPGNAYCRDRPTMTDARQAGGTILFEVVR